MPDLIGPSGFILIRVAVAALLFFSFHKAFVKEKVRDRKDYFRLFAAGFFGVAMNMLFFFNGLAHTNELNASVLMLNAPVFVLGFSAIMLKTKPHHGQIAGVLIAAIGAVLLIGGSALEFDSRTAKGDIMIVVNAVSFAFYLVYVKPLLGKYSVATITRYTFGFGVLIVLPIGLPELLEVDFGLFTPRAWASLAFVAIATTFFAYFLNAWAVQKASPVLVGTYIYLQPVIATLIAQMLGKGVLTIERVIFALLICTGVFLVGKYKRRT